MPGFLTALVILAFAASRIAVISVPFEREFDEGVYLLSARAVAAGYGLFSAVFSSQPPAFIESLAVALRLFGDTLQTGRWFILAFAMLAVASAAGLSRRLSAPVAGRAAARWAAPTAAAALAMSLTFGDLAHVVQAEMPAFAVALASLCTCFHARDRGWHRGWLFATGAVFATALMFKLIALPYAAPLGLLLLLSAAGEDAAWKLDGRGAGLLRRTVGRALAVSLGFLVVVSLPLLFYDHRDLYAQNVAFHIAKHGAYVHDRLENLARAANQLGDDAMIVAAAAVALLLLAAKSRLATAWLLAWFSFSLAAIVEQTPLFWRHFALLSPPLAVACGLLPATLLPGASPRSRLAIFLLMMAILSAPALLSSGHRGVLRTWNPASERRELMTDTLQYAARWVHDYTSRRDLVAGDDPIVIYLSGRNSPPGLCDTSLARIISGALTLREATRASSTAALIVLQKNGRLTHLEGYREWLHQHYTEQPLEETGYVGARTMWTRNDAR